MSLDPTPIQLYLSSNNCTYLNDAIKRNRIGQTITPIIVLKDTMQFYGSLTHKYRILGELVRNSCWFDRVSCQSIRYHHKTLLLRYPLTPVLTSGFSILILHLVNIKYL